MLAALKNIPRLVEGITSTPLLAGSAWSTSETGDAEAETPPEGDVMKRETTEPREESITGTLAQMAQGLAQVYADRERPERTGRLHRV